MGVTVTDVRAALNNITVGNLADETITLFIEKAEKLSTAFSDNDNYVRSYAAYHGFLRSKVYDATRTGDLSVKKNWKPFIDELKKELDEEEMKLFGCVVPVVTPMYDNRPSDPHESGEMNYGDY